MRKLFRRNAARIAALGLAMTLCFTGCKKENGTASESTSLKPGETAIGSAITTERVTDPDAEGGRAEGGAAEGEADQPAGADRVNGAEAVLDNYDNVFVVTDREKIYVREIPSSAGQIIGYIERGGGGNVVQQTVDSTWVEVESGGLHGYVSVGYIATGAPGRTAAVDHAVERVKITLDNVNIRLSASTDGTVIDSALSGTLYDYLGEEGDFYKIRYGAGIEAYVSKTCGEQGIFLHEAVAKKMNSVTVGINAFGSEEDGGAALTGSSSGTAAYVLNLQIAQRLAIELEARGYEVCLVRDGNSCTLTEKERAAKAYSYGANCLIGIKCGKSDDAEESGVVTFYGTTTNLSSASVEAGRVLSSVIAQYVGAATAANQKGGLQSDSFESINTCRATSIVIQAGYLSNAWDDMNLNDAGYQAMIARGIADGLDRYYGFGK